MLVPVQQGFDVFIELGNRDGTAHEGAARSVCSAFPASFGVLRSATTLPRTPLIVRTGLFTAEFLGQQHCFVDRHVRRHGLFINNFIHRDAQNGRINTRQAVGGPALQEPPEDLIQFRAMQPYTVRQGADIHGIPFRNTHQIDEFRYLTRFFTLLDLQLVQQLQGEFSRFSTTHNVSLTSAEQSRWKNPIQQFTHFLLVPQIQGSDNVPDKRQNQDEQGLEEAEDDPAAAPVRIQGPHR